MSSIQYQPGSTEESHLEQENLSKSDTIAILLDTEELQLLRDFERGEFASLKNFRAEKRQLEAAARRTLQKGKRINIRISARDLEKIQKRAVAEGIPYQTLIASTLHKFVTGQLKETK